MHVRHVTIILTGVAMAIAPWRPAVSAQSQWQDVVRNLRHPNAETRLAAVERLGEVRYTPAAEAVAPLLNDPDVRVQLAALDTELGFFLMEPLGGGRLLTLGSSKSHAQTAFDTGPLLRTALAAPPVLIDQLIKAMRDENARVRFDAVHALGFIAEPPLPPAQGNALSEELDHYEPIIRAATARVLGRLHAREAGSKLILALVDSSPLVREYAVEALGMIREDRALAPLREMVLRAKGEPVRDAMLALARIGSAFDRSLFRERLSDRDPKVRRAAVEGLGRLRDRESLDAIAQIQKTDRAAEVKLAAAFALQLLGQTQTHVIAPMLILRNEGAQARDYLFEIGHDSLPGIASTLKVATDPRHRADLLQVAGYLGRPEDLSVVQPFVQDKNDRVLRAAANAVERIKRVQ